jgi:thiamine-monophosphate kinase
MPARDTTLGPGAEFAIIAKLRRRWGDLSRGIGDDAALLDVPRGEQLVASTDASVEGVHFKRTWLTPREIGYRAVTGALSDLAAMGAAPLGVLVSLQLPSKALAAINGLADGVGDAVRAARTLIVGGNLARGDSVAITTTVLGHAYAPLRRTGARPGDLLYVTGTLGGPAAALRAFRSRKNPEKALRARFAHPVARIAEARWLAARGAVAAIDISDGLVADAGHLAAAMGAGVELNAERVPIMAGATLSDALTGGEEYELLVAARTPLAADEFLRTFGIPLTAIGRMVEGPARVRVPGAPRVAALRGHDHFSR